MSFSTSSTGSTCLYPRRGWIQILIITSIKKVMTCSMAQRFIINTAKNAISNDHRHRYKCVRVIFIFPFVRFYIMLFIYFIFLVQGPFDKRIYFFMRRLRNKCIEWQIDCCKIIYNLFNCINNAKCSSFC